MRKFMLLFISLSLTACLTNYEEEVASFVIPFENIDNSNLDEIIDRIGDRDIIILGEVGHGDGKTIEVKSKLIKYLVEKHGFNTLALEMEGFLDMEIRSQLESIDPDWGFIKNESWMPNWGYSEQGVDLANYIKSNKTLNLIGLEGRTLHHKQLHNFLITRMKILVEMDEVLKFNNLYKKIYGVEASKTTLKEIDFYQKQIETVIKLDSEINQNEFLIRVLNNEIEMLTNFKYYQIIGGDEGINKYVNFRDKTMAYNLIWHKKRNPKAKIIVWTANFHGAKNCSKVRYKEEEPDLYNSFTLFSDYLVEAYGDKVYSMAFTSSEGSVKEFYMSEEISHDVLNIPNNSLEFELSKSGIDFGYLDFLDIKNKKPYLGNLNFNSVMLGYDNKPGEWLNVFDGVFYIKKNEPPKVVKL